MRTSKLLCDENGRLRVKREAAAENLGDAILE
jgi:hypothetical protein